eukprot:scaffold224512_cov35-Tisochrysis_lutea.AAC.5
MSGWSLCDVLHARARRVVECLGCRSRSDSAPAESDVMVARAATRPASLNLNRGLNFLIFIIRAR